MRIAIVGSGYVGLVSGTCFASTTIFNCFFISFKLLCYNFRTSRTAVRNRDATRISYLTMVSERSGPTEMIFTGTPVSRSMNST